MKPFKGYFTKGEMILWSASVLAIIIFFFALISWLRNPQEATVAGFIGGCMKDY